MSGTISRDAFERVRIDRDRYATECSRLRQGLRDLIEWDDNRAWLQDDPGPTAGAIRSLLDSTNPPASQ